jgi:hypothetical protein
MMTEDIVARLRVYEWAHPVIKEAADEIELILSALKEIECLSRREAEGSPNRKIIHQIAFHVITGEKTDD